MGWAATGRRPARCCGMTRSLCAVALLLLVQPLLAFGAPPPAAELYAIGIGGATMRARVEGAPGNYRLIIRCEDGCPGSVEHAEDVGQIPLGLFQIWDGDGLLMSTWAAASVYVVRAHLLTPQGVRPVLEAASRSAPGFALDNRGRMTVTTTERRGGPRDGLRTIAWRWDGTRFRIGQR